MEHLLPVINKLQDVFNTVGEGNLIQLPQIVVVGAQSSGKSSVLENIVGWDFLPRGTGIVTRVPLIIQLINIPPRDQRIGGRVPSIQSAPNAEMWATFLHHPDRTFTDFDEVRAEIEARTDVLVGSNKNVADKPITLKIYSPHVLNLTMVDLPGITKVAIEGQPKDIETQIRELVLKYIRNPNSIILAVSAANVDIANSDSIQIAKEIDPDGHRTIGVCTKLDLMDKGTNALDVLAGKLIKLKLGIIGVVNRSQYDIDHKKSIKESIASEAEFFQSNYPTLSSRCGTSFLTGTLNRVLLSHIRTCLPDLRSRIKTLQKSTRDALNQLGNPAFEGQDKSRILLTILNKFSQSYCASINGTGLPFNSNHELSGGAMICTIFHDRYGHFVESMDPLDSLSNEDIHTQIRNAAGTRPSLFAVPDLAFDVLIKRQIALLEDPSYRCVEQVYEELERLMHSCSAQELSQYRNLREKVLEVVSSLLRQRIPATHTMVANLIAIEKSYINTSHPDFEGGEAAIANLYSRVMSSSNTPMITKPPTPSFSGSATTTTTATAATSHHEGRPFTPDPTSKTQQQTTTAPTNSTNTPLVTSNGTTNSLSLNDQKPIEQAVDSSFMQFFGFGRRSNQQPSAPQQQLQKKVEANVQRSFSESDFASSQPQLRNPPQSHLQLGSRDQMEVDLVRALIRSYFNIVRKNIQDAIPKTIMHFMVNNVMENISNELVSKLFVKEHIDFLLQEDPNIASQRKRASEMMEALNRAANIISEVYDDSPVTM